MSTQKQKFELFARLSDLGFTYDESVSLRRIEMTLKRWAERECGYGYGWAIERDETTGKPFFTYHGEGKARRYPVADREAGAIRRLKEILLCRNARLGLAPTSAKYIYGYHQGDCRGCMLYLVTRDSLAPQGSNPIVQKAQMAGAKIHFRDIENREPSGCFVCLDMHGTELFSQTFNSEQLAAEAYLKHRGLAIPAADILPIDQYYNRGLAVCA